jgi:hypothetical protein
MILIAHRINRRNELEALPSHYGVEVDIRADGKTLVLNHDPFEGGEDLAAYLKGFQHRFIIFNVKEAGTEKGVIETAQKFGIENYFLLDVEFPYLYRAARSGNRQLAVRFSEDEGIDTVLKYRGMVDWVWIDTQTQLPLTPKTVKHLQGFRCCLVSPDRWGRPDDIPRYQAIMKELSFEPAAVMTGKEYLSQWEQ